MVQMDAHINIRNWSAKSRASCSRCLADSLMLLTKEMQLDAFHSTFLWRANTSIEKLWSFFFLRTPKLLAKEMPMVALHSTLRWRLQLAVNRKAVGLLLSVSPRAVQERDPISGMLPFEQAYTSNDISVQCYEVTHVQLAPPQPRLARGVFAAL